jgi:glycosyltransferase involved in cell wall biosynthesis
MRLLVVAPYHVSGTLGLLQRELRRRGHEMRYVTLFQNPWGFSEDICLDLPLQPHIGGWIVKARRLLHRITRGPLADETPIEETPPMWRSPSPLASAFFAFRDAWIAPRALSAVREHNLDSFDVYWLDQGQEIFRDGRLAIRWAGMGKSMMAFYHGSDMRNRGVFPKIDRHLGLRLTSEVDLMTLDDRLQYLFLPYDTNAVTPERRTWVHDSTVRIAHAARVRAFKGTDTIIEVVERLKERHKIELMLIENMTHQQAMQIKCQADIVVDQIADTGGWGYGMSSVEALSLGLPVLTRMRPEMVTFLPDHPFVHVTAESLEPELERLITDAELRETLGAQGRNWVVEKHDVSSVVDALLEYFDELGWV